MRAKGKRDRNHQEIVACFRSIGFSVADTGNVGDGFPDLVVAYAGLTALVEIKDGAQPPSRRALTPMQKKFHADWHGTIYTVLDVEDCMTLQSILLAELQWKKKQS